MEGAGKMSAGNEHQGRFKRICVFCGSRAGYKSAFSDAALELGKLLVIRTLLIFTYSSKNIGLLSLCKILLLYRSFA